MVSCSIILPVYNGEEYIMLAIDSLLAQTLKDFELIIINDGSTDRTLEFIKSFDDKRIVLVSRENKGLVASLNEGIALAKGSLIARQDADDISEPRRLEKQVEHFLENKELVLLGTSISTIDMEGAVINKHCVIVGKNAVKAELLIRSPFAHGSVMFRKDIFERAGGYLKDEWPAEDYGLWVRMAQYGELNNLPDYLYRYRENTQGISAQNITAQQDRTIVARTRAWEDSDQLVRLFRRFEKQPANESRNRLINNFIDTYKIAGENGNKLLQIRLISVLLTSPSLLRKIAGKIRRSI